MERTRTDGEEAAYRALLYYCQHAGPSISPNHLDHAIESLVCNLLLLSNDYGSDASRMAERALDLCDEPECFDDDLLLPFPPPPTT